MKKRMLILTLVGMLLLSLIISCAQSTPLPETEVSDPEALIVDKCSDCHSVNRVFSADYTEDGWNEVIDEMIGKGANVTDEEKEIMIDWLSARN